MTCNKIVSTPASLCSDGAGGVQLALPASPHLVSGSTFNVRCWMLDVGCWMLDAGCWMLDVGCSALSAFRFSPAPTLVSQGVSLTDLRARYDSFLPATVKNLPPDLMIHQRAPLRRLSSVAHSQPPRCVCREAGWPAHRKKTTRSGRPDTTLKPGPQSAAGQEWLPTSGGFLLDRGGLEPEPMICCDIPHREHGAKASRALAHLNPGRCHLPGRAIGQADKADRKARRRRNRAGTAPKNEREQQQSKRRKDNGVFVPVRHDI